nr:MAG TPA: hypothetical protein [Caudoviricetes sp.]
MNRTSSYDIRTYIFNKDRMACVRERNLTPVSVYNTQGEHLCSPWCRMFNKRI